MKKPRILKTDGTEVEVTPKNGKDFTLDELYAIVGTNDPMIQIVPLRSKGEILVCHDNGIAMGLPPNDNATMYCAVDVYLGPQGIVGDVLICPPNMIE